MCVVGGGGGRGRGGRGVAGEREAGGGGIVTDKLISKYFQVAFSSLRTMA